MRALPSPCCAPTACRQLVRLASDFLSTLHPLSAASVSTYLPVQPYELLADSSGFAPTIIVSYAATLIEAAKSEADRLAGKTTITYSGPDKHF